ncbi:MAG: multi-sensor hybrid histidine kinase, partial [Deltaproteobacteria bacterium]|nr:multi-sensor hybrid histidine kinase [Deltaproteobacteria bacterium]
MDQRKRGRIRREQLRLVIAQLPTMQAASLLVALVLAFSVRGTFGPGRIASWILLLLAVAAGRLIYYRRFFKARPERFESAVWEKGYLLLSVFSGIVWGLSAFLLLPVGNISLTLAFVLVVASLSATTTVSHASLKFGSAAWVTPAMSLYAARLLLHEGEVERTIGLLSILYMITILAYSFKHHRMIVSSIALRFENEGLLEEARQSGERYRILFQRSPVGIFVYDERLQITECNERFSEILGSGREALIGLDMNRLKDERILPALRAPLEGREGSYEGLYHATLSKAVLFVSMRTVPYRGADGAIRGGIGIVEDVTRRKRMEEEQRIFASLVDHSTDLIEIASLDGEVFYLNRAGQELVGMDPPDGERKPEAGGYALEKDRGAQREMLEALRRTGAWNGETSIRHMKTGLPVPVEVHAFVIKDPESGKAIALASISRDLSLRKKMEEEMARSEKLDSIGILAGGIAHDINNFLTAIVGNVALAKMYANRQGDAYKRMEEIEKAAFRAKDVAQQLLTFSKGGAPVKRVTSIRDLTMESAGFALRGSNVKCEFSFPDDLWHIEADEGQLSQVVNNLLINAAHSMPGGGTIQVVCRNVVIGAEDPILRPGNHVSVSVMDHGIGIPPEILSRIFDPYFTTKQKGSGLGLSTAYSIIKRHGGRLSVESHPGIGTSFHFCLPATEGAVPAPDVDEERWLSGQGRILVMDDEESVRDMAREMLAMIGYTVTIARDGTEAVAIYRQAMACGEPFDLVLMDLTIPGGMGGKETIRKLLEIDRNVKAVVCSGYSNDPIMSSCEEYGFRGVIRKPYSVKQLNKLINDILFPGSPDRLETT